MSQTMHSGVLQEWGTPPPPPTNSASGCTGPAAQAVLNDFVDMNLTGNGVGHQTVNAAGDAWFTATFEGTGTLTFYPLSSLSNVVIDSGGNLTSIPIPLPNTSPALILTGHLMQWFGFEANKQNAIGHGTTEFHGVSGTGVPVSFHDQFQFRWAVGANQFGPPTVFTNKITC